MKKLFYFIIPILFTSLVAGFLFFSNAVWLIKPSISYSVSRNVTAVWQKNGTTYLIIAGGRTASGVTQNVIMRNMVTNSEIPLPPLPVAIERAGGFVFYDSLYIFGGSSDTGSLSFLNIFMKINLNQPVSWSSKGNIPFSVSDMSVAKVSDSVVYSAGGKTLGTSVKQILRYSLNLNQWTIVGQLPVTESGISNGAFVSVSDSVLLYAGGKTPNGYSGMTYRGIVNKYFPYNIIWQSSFPYPAGNIAYLAGWGNGKGKAFFTGGDLAFPDNPSAVGLTYIYTDTPPRFDTVDIKPTPVVTTQVDGIRTGGSPAPEINQIFAPGGAANLNGPSLNNFEELFVIDSNLTEISPNENIFPEKFILEQNYPNPFNNSTVFKFQTYFSSKVTFEVFDINGKKLYTVINKFLNAGNYQFNFNAAKLSSGVYLYRLSTGDFSEIKKFVLIK